MYITANSRLANDWSVRSRRLLDSVWYVPINVLLYWSSSTDVLKFPRIQSSLKYDCLQRGGKLAGGETCLAVITRASRVDYRRSSTYNGSRLALMEQEPAARRVHLILTTPINGNVSLFVSLFVDYIRVLNIVPPAHCVQSKVVPLHYVWNKFKINIDDMNKRNMSSCNDYHLRIILLW